MEYEELFKKVDLIPNRLAYVWLYARPGPRGDGCDGPDWPVNGWAPYIIWRWTKHQVEIYKIAPPTKIRIPRNHPILRTAQIVPDEMSDPKELGNRFLDSLELYDRVDKGYPTSCIGVANYLSKLSNFDDTPTQIEGDDDVAKAKKETSGGADKPKRGSGSWIRDQLLKKNNKATDEEIAAQARDKFGGKTGPGDVKWNRNKLRREGELPPVERKAKSEKPAKSSKKAA